MDFFSREYYWNVHGNFLRLFLTVKCNEYLIFVQADKYYMEISIDTSVVKNICNFYQIEV